MGDAERMLYRTFPAKIFQGLLAKGRHRERHISCVGNAFVWSSGKLVKLETGTCIYVCVPPYGCPAYQRQTFISNKKKQRKKFCYLIILDEILIVIPSINNKLSWITKTKLNTGIQICHVSGSMCFCTCGHVSLCCIVLRKQRHYGWLTSPLSRPAKRLKNVLFQNKL